MQVITIPSLLDDHLLQTLILTRRDSQKESSHKTRHRMRVVGQPLWLLFLLVSVIHCDALAAKANAATSDADLVEQQLGYLPRNYHGVSARNSKGVPIAIKTYPLLRKKGSEGKPLELKTFSASPFPTSYWLTCPNIARAIGELERIGYIGHIVDYLNLDQNSAKRNNLLQCHEQCGDDRWATLTPSDRQFFIDHAKDHSTVSRMVAIIKDSGISGLEFKRQGPGLKCLHTHYAYFRSIQQNDSSGREENPVGRIVHDILGKEFPDLDL